MGFKFLLTFCVLTSVIEAQGPDPTEPETTSNEPTGPGTTVPESINPGTTNIISGPDPFTTTVTPVPTEPASINNIYAVAIATPIILTFILTLVIAFISIGVFKCYDSRRNKDQREHTSESSQNG